MPENCVHLLLMLGHVVGNKIQETQTLTKSNERLLGVWEKGVVGYIFKQSLHVTGEFATDTVMLSSTISTDTLVLWIY